MLHVSSQPYRDNDAEEKSKFPTVNFSLNLFQDVKWPCDSLNQLAVERR